MCVRVKTYRRRTRCSQWLYRCYSIMNNYIFHITIIQIFIYSYIHVYFFQFAHRIGTFVLFLISTKFQNPGEKLVKLLFPSKLSHLMLAPAIA